MKHPEPARAQTRLAVKPLRGNPRALTQLKSVFSEAEGIHNIGIVPSSGEVLISHDSRITEAQIIELILRLIGSS